MHRLAFIPLIVLLAAACVEDSDHVAAPRPITVPEPQPTALVYVVEPGDYLALVAERFDVPLSRLIELNPNIQDPALIEIGEEILIEEAPPAPQVTPAAATTGAIGDQTAAADESRWPINVELSSDQVRLAALGAAAVAASFAIFFAMRAVTIAAYRAAAALRRAVLRQRRRGDDPPSIPAGSSGSGSQPAGGIGGAAAGSIAMAAVLPGSAVAVARSPGPLTALAHATSSGLDRWGRAAGRSARQLAVSSAHATRATRRATVHSLRAAGVRARPYVRSAARWSRIAARAALLAIARGARRGGVLLRRGARLAATRPRQAWAERQDHRGRMRLRLDVEERGTVALRLGLIDESEQYFRDSLERSQREEWHSESGISLLGLADIAASRGHSDEAMTHLDRAEEAFALAGDEAYRRQVTAKRATLEAAADAEAAQPRANAAASIGPGLAGVLEQHSADEAGETPVR